MNTLSLSPRADLFHFKFPKDFLPKEVEEKYAKAILREKNVITTPIDYLNESIQHITFPGLSDLLVKQKQHSPMRPATGGIQRGLGTTRINIEPARENVTYSPANILSQIAGEFTVTFRKNQGLYNYFMMYETIFHKILKQYANEETDELFTVEILDEDGKIMGRMKLFQPRVDGIDGLDFSFNKLERQPDTFDVKFAYNNIDFDLLDDDLYPNQLENDDKEKQEQ